MPQLVHFWINASVSGCAPRSGTELFRKLNPRNSNEKPMIISPIFFFFLDFAIIKTNPRPIRGIEITEISALKPNRAIIQAVMVVPMLAPIITPIDWVNVRRPAFTKLTTITVVALDDWIMAVIMKPVKILLNEFDVIAANTERSFEPATF